MTVNANNITIFGRTLSPDPYNNITQVDNRTVIITPWSNNSVGLIELKVGLFLPFTQSRDMFTEQIVWGGSSAIRMAVNEINAQHLIPGAYVTLIEKDSFPDSSVDQAAVTNAVYSLVTLLQDGVIGVIGDVTSSWTALSALITSTLNLPQCSFTASSEAFSDKSQYGYFFRTIPTDIVMIDALLRFVAQQGWTKVGVLYSDDALGQQLYQRTIQQSEQLNIQLVNYQSFPASNPTSTAVNNALHNVTNSGARVLLLASSGQAQADFMVQAALSGYVTADYVWLLVDDTVARVLPNTLQQANANLTMATSFNGIFWISNWLTLNGYSPYDNFLNQWDALDSAIFPEAGGANITTNEGLAYSCMMMMAHGFKNMVTNSTNQTNQLWQLASGDLDVAMKPNVFNVGYVGPNGPMLLDSNGDMMAGNYHIINNQQSSFVTVATFLIGQLTMNATPMFFDGTSQIPSDSPPSFALNPPLTSVISFFILIIAGIGSLFALAMFCLVVFNRQHPVFKAASPLFCCLELVGFVLTYLSVIMMIGDPTPVSCILMPVSFNLGFLLVLSNMIAKNYRIYRIFNNILIRRTVITDGQLAKSVTLMMALELVIVITGLVLVKPSPERVPVTLNSYYWSCEAGHPYTTVFSVLIATYAGILLLVATFLAYKTRLAGKQYERYSECRQMGLSIYNILFCCLVAFVIMVNPMADYYTKYYICVVSALWATTFSLFILFLPLLHNFFQEKRRDHQKWNRSQQQSLHQTSSGHSQHLSHHLHLPRTHGQVPGATIEVTPATLASLGPASHPSLSTSTTSGHASTALTPSSGLSHHQGLAHLHHKPPVDPEDHDHDHELLNLEEILGSSVPIIRPHPDAASCLDPHDQASSHQSLSPHHFLYEGDMPVRKVFRYLPWLAPWQMVHLMAFPGLGYITTMSKLGAQGYAMAYDHATIHCNLGDTFILKIRGRGYWDMLIQVPSWKHLERWHQRLNHTSGSAITTSSISSSHEEPLPAAEAISLTPKSRLIP